MLDDSQLLQKYIQEDSEAAFSELVARHVNLVYSAALRRTNGDSHRAQDVAQIVFTDLARKARALPRHVILAGWLHRATRYAAAQLERTEQRRQLREQEAAAMNILSSEPSPGWDQIKPVLDHALDKLRRADRDALLLRFFEQRSFAEVGRALGTNEDAARKRVNRALEKLRTHLGRHGLTTTAGMLSGAISANGMQLAPAGLAAALTSVSLASAGTTTGFTVTVLKLMSMTKLQLGAGAAAFIVLTTSLVLQHQSQVALQHENASLRRQVAQLGFDNETLSQRLTRRTPTPTRPAPPMRATAVLEEFNEGLSPSSKLYTRLLDKELKLSVEQVKAHLQENGSNAASLLASYRTSGDSALLEEAMKKFPNDPLVAFEAAMMKDATPEAKREWLEAFKKSDPDNALGNYLSAAEHFKSGNPDQAIQEFLAASGKSFHDYSAQRCQDDTEAYLTAGYPEAEAKTASALQLLLPQLAQVRDAGLNMIELANSYRQTGDETSAQAALQLAVQLGQRYSTPHPGEATVSQLVGIFLERNALNSMNPQNAYNDSGVTVQDRIQQLTAQAKQLKEMNRQIEPMFQIMSDSDWINYRDRWLMFGEENAARWLLNKYPQN